MLIDIELIFILIFCIVIIIIILVRRLILENVSLFNLYKHHIYI